MVERIYPSRRQRASRLVAVTVVLLTLAAYLLFGSGGALDIVFNGFLGVLTVAFLYRAAFNSLDIENGMLVMTRGFRAQKVDLAEVTGVARPAERHLLLVIGYPPLPRKVPVTAVPKKGKHRDQVYDRLRDLIANPPPTAGGGDTPVVDAALRRRKFALAGVAVALVAGTVVAHVAMWVPDVDVGEVLASDAPEIPAEWGQQSADWEGPPATFEFRSRESMGYWSSGLAHVEVEVLTYPTPLIAWLAARPQRLEGQTSMVISPLPEEWTYRSTVAADEHVVCSLYLGTSDCASWYYWARYGRTVLLIKVDVHADQAFAERVVASIDSRVAARLDGSRLPQGGSGGASG